MTLIAINYTNDSRCYGFSSKRFFCVLKWRHTLFMFFIVLMANAQPVPLSHHFFYDQIADAQMAQIENTSSAAIKPYLNDVHVNVEEFRHESLILFSEKPAQPPIILAYKAGFARIAFLTDSGTVTTPVCLEV